MNIIFKINSTWNTKFEIPLRLTCGFYLQMHNVDNTFNKYLPDSKTKTENLNGTHKYMRFR